MRAARFSRAASLVSCFQMPSLKSLFSTQLSAWCPAASDALVFLAGHENSPCEVAWSRRGTAGKQTFAHHVLLASLRWLAQTERNVLMNTEATSAPPVPPSHNVLRQHPLVFYFLLAYGFTWVYVLVFLVLLHVPFPRDM